MKIAVGVIIFLVMVCIALLSILLSLNHITKKRGKKYVEDKINFFRNIWGTFVIFVISTSVIAIFIASICINKKIGLDIINNWVSVILGLVATFGSVASLFLSFYNVDQANDMQVKYKDEIRKIKEEITINLNNTQEAIINIVKETHKDTMDKLDYKTVNQENVDLQPVALNEDVNKYIKLDKKGENKK